MQEIISIFKYNAKYILNNKKCKMLTLLGVNINFEFPIFQPEADSPLAKNFE